MNGQHGTSRGIALITVMFVMVIMMILIGALLLQMPEELRGITYGGFDNRALYVADSGIQDLTEQIEEAEKGGFAPNVAPSPYYLPAESDGTKGYYRIKILDQKTVNGRNYFLIDSVGHSPHGEIKHIQAVLQQAAFNQYDYFGKNNAPGNFFVAGLMSFDGPVYLEGNTNPVNLQWYNGLPPPALFQDNLEVSNNYAWYGPGGAFGVAPANQAQWNVVDAKGQPGVAFTGPDAVPFPPEVQNAQIANQAFNGTAATTIPSPATGNEVYMNGGVASATGGVVSSGIFVQGDVDISLTSSADGKRQTFEFTPEAGSLNTIPKGVKILVDFSANTTTVTEGVGVTAVVKTYTGVPNGTSPGGSGPNGAIFVNGDVLALSGTVSGQYTIAVPDMGAAGSATRHNIYVTGDITMHKDPQTCSCTSPDILGLIANDVIVQVPPQGPTPVNRTIEAAIFAGNKTETVGAEADGTYKTQYGSGGGVCGGSVPLQGSLLVYGSTVNNYISPLGCFNPSTGALVHGFADSYSFDNRFRTMSPPFWPREFHYSIVAWKDLGYN